MRITSLVSLLAISAFAATPALANSGMVGDAAMTITAPYPTMTNDFNVSMNKTEIVILPDVAEAIIIGNPTIADVTVHSDDTLFIVGRGYGDTNIIILNASGDKIMDAMINVVGSKSHKNVRIYEGGSDMRRTFNCSPFCLPAPVLGDDSEFRSRNQGRAVSSSSSSGGAGGFGGAANVGSVNENIAESTEGGSDPSQEPH